MTTSRDLYEVHHYIQCDGCNMSPIKGPVFSMSLGEDTFDLCECCHRELEPGQQALLKRRFRCKEETSSTRFRNLVDAAATSASRVSFRPEDAPASSWKRAELQAEKLFTGIHSRALEADLTKLAADEMAFRRRVEKEIQAKDPRLHYDGIDDDERVLGQGE